MNNTLLEAKAITAVRQEPDGDETTLLEDLSFSLYKGETLGIVGESGSGKSILVSALMRILPPGCSLKSGKVYFEGRDMYRIQRKELDKIRGFQIAMISDNPLEILDPICTVEKQVRETIMAHNRGMSKADVIQKGLSIFSSLRMPDPEKMMHSYPYQLSGGMKQRVAIALALCGDVKLLIADDATRSLDVTVAAQIMEILRKMKEDNQLSLIWISNSLPVCSLLAEKVMIMYNGKILEIGPKEKILTDPKHFYTQKLLEVTPKFEGFDRDEKFKGFKIKTGASIHRTGSGCEFYEICDYAREKCQTVAPGLFDIDDTHQCRCHYI
jgi:oligopeptide/dipeptide ABC transporter ATP-binding protein